MTCDCSDYEIPTVYRERTQIARKRHRCSECGGTVYPGEQYRYAFGVWDGAAGAFSICPRCLEAEAQFRATTRACAGRSARCTRARSRASPIRAAGMGPRLLSTRFARCGGRMGSSCRGGRNDRDYSRRPVN